MLSFFPPRTQWGYEEDIPESIKSKTSQLNALHCMMNKIEVGWEALHKEYIQLEDELEPFRIHNDVTNLSIPNPTDICPSHITNSPINRCPDDIMYLVFELCLIPIHQEVGNLLLVCKHWHRMVMSSPKLWARMQILDTEDLFEGDNPSITLSYVSACMERSCGLLLDVELELSSLPSRSDYIFGELRATLMLIVNEDDEDDATEQLESLEWDFECSLYETKFKNAIEGLFGAKSISMDRWGSLSLTLPSDEQAASSVWRKLGGPCRNLKSLIIDNVPLLDNDVEWLNSSGFQDLSSLKSLDTSQSWEWISLEVFSISPANLETLKMGFDESMTDFHALQTLTQLHSLVLVGLVPDDDVPSKPSTEFHRRPLRLPNLKHLTLEGEYGALSSLKFDFPVLEQLTVCTTDSFQNLPDVSPRTFRWHIHPGYEKRWMNVDAGFAMTCFTQPFMVTVECLIVPGLAKWQAIPLVLTKYIPKSKKFLDCLKYLVLEHENGDVERIGPQEAEEIYARIEKMNYLEQAIEEAIHRDVLLNQ